MSWKVQAFNIKPLGTLHILTISNYPMSRCMRINFLKKPVKQADKVILFTKRGINSHRDLGNGTMEYTYNWGT